jgi:adenosylmethionine---8-amino-7-oxononanoate aminotransferase
MTASPIWHPFTQHGLQDEIPMIERAEGAWLYGADGRAWLDCISSWWVTTHGHCEPHIMAAIRAQANTLDQIIFAGWTHASAEKLAAHLVDITPHGLDHVFFSDSGSTAVEVALKMALGVWRTHQPPRHKIIVMEHSYHGDTIGAMSVGARGVFNQAYAPLLFDVERVPFPKTDGAETLAQLEEYAPQAAAFIVEPLILGAGGMLMYPAYILKAMREICTRHGTLFIADEIMTGWGRTGALFACEQAGIAPDILCLSKGLTGGSLPLAVTLASRRVYQAHYSESRADMFYHSSSYTANPIACAAALANLELWQGGAVMGRITQLSAWQSNLLTQINLPNIHNKRQCGTIVAFEIGNIDSAYLNALGPKLAATFRARGLLLRPMGNTLYLMPPYCITYGELARAYALIEEIVGALV